MSINRVIITGNLTRDIQMRATAGGMSIGTFGMAVNDRRKNPQTGDWEDYPNFIDCTLFGKRAESLERYLKKGQKVAIEGKLRWSQWEQNGTKRSKLEVIVEDIELTGAKNAQEGATTQVQNAYQPQPAQQTQGSFYDEDIPF